MKDIFEVASIPVSREPLPLTKEIEHVQTFLKAAGFDPGLIDGKLGTQTRRALQQYQQQHGLPMTGE